MFYKMIENKCTQWYESERCTVKNLIEYIEKTGQMRDAQIEAIKVYLFLKIACECKPLTQLFRQGFFNSIDLNEIELSKSTREYLFQNPAAATLFEYACLTNDKGEQVSEKLEKQIKKDPTGIDYNEFFRNAFYGVSYTDYLFSLPMGAGKTYLMAAFIYLDLYFAYNEPTNPSFAHNFIIFAPSGLKSSVVPSLKTIQNFNPSWILPEPAATDIKRMISFEVLDQSKTAKKSNKTKNPNVQKIANHQPLSELFGLVAVTNAEKVILERIQEKQGQINMFEESEDDKDRQANELRNLIGKLPSLSTYKDTVYADGLTAKLGIYCGTIEKLEETVYPQVSRIVAEYGLGTDVILKFHKGNKQYKMSADSQMQFDILDKSISEIRIVLLVQIGKEGWDCRSLTGIILSQEGDCPTNMVLQTSCRCLRQVIKNGQETALIYLNESNAEKLNMQLERQHHISLKEFSSADNSKTTLKRYNRTAYLKLPKVEFYQLKISYDTLTVEKANPEVSIEKSVDSAQIAGNIIKTTDLSMNVNNISIQVDDAEYGTEYATFNSWIYGIMRSGFGTPSMAELNAYTEQLKVVYEKITYEKGGSRYFSSKYNKKLVEANIRKAFCDKTDFNTTEELIPEEANLLNIANFTSEIYADNLDDYYPRQNVVENIMADDQGKLKVDKKTQQLIDLAIETGNDRIVLELQQRVSSHPNKNRSFHYLPYRTDSGFEQTFLREVLSFDIIEELGLEVYYNGDRAMTEFKIKCYKKTSGKWNYIGIYTPDFLIIKRKDGVIHKVIVVETKGQIYAKDPVFKDKKNFMETEFSKQNNAAYGYERFDYLYLEDTMPEKDRLTQTHQKICEFFKEKA